MSAIDFKVDLTREPDGGGDDLRGRLAGGAHVTGPQLIGSHVAGRRITFYPPAVRA